MAYNTQEERLKVKGSEQITRDLKVNRDAYINNKLEAGRIESKGDLTVDGEIIARDDVSISGDLYVNGTEHISNTETAQTTDNYLVLRHNQTTALGNDEYSGVAVHNYTLGKTATITADNEGTWRVADNTETDHDYTNLSYYNGSYYQGLTRTVATVVSGMKTAFDEDELDESVYYNNSYYHFDGSHWYPVSLTDNKLTLGSAVTDSATITALNALTKSDLIYFRTLTVTTINELENQPLLTRDETTDMADGQTLVWDNTNEKAVTQDAYPPITFTYNSQPTDGEWIEVAKLVSKITGAGVNKRIMLQGSIDVTNRTLTNQDHYEFLVRIGTVSGAAWDTSLLANTEQNDNFRITYAYDTDHIVVRVYAKILEEYTKFHTTISKLTDSTDYKNLTPILGSGLVSTNTSVSAANIVGTVVPFTEYFDPVTNALVNLPTDAVLHYSFDEVPDLPDGTAVYRKNKDFTTTSDWSSAHSTLSIVNNSLKVQSNADEQFFQIYGSQTNASSMAGKILKIRCKSNAPFIFGTQDNGGNYVVRRFSIKDLGGNEYEIIGALETSYSYAQMLLFAFTTTSVDNYVEISQIYIGDGSYTTPVIDNANGQNNGTNNGGIAVQGVSGKGAFFPSATQEMRIPVTNLPAPTSNENFTISCWLKINSDYVNDTTANTVKPIVSIGISSATGVVGLARRSNTIGYINRDSSNVRTVETPMKKDGKWHNYIGVYDGTTHKSTLYEDGVLIGTSDANIANFQFGNGVTYWHIWSNNTITGNTGDSTNQPATLDDLLFFNRSLSQEEVTALYLNKANTPKYFPSLTDKIEEGNWGLATSNAVAQAISSAVNIITIPSPGSSNASYVMIKTTDYSRINGILTNRYSGGLYICGKSVNYGQFVYKLSFFTYSIQGIKTFSNTTSGQMAGYMLIKYSGYNPLTFTPLDKSKYTYSSITQAQYEDPTLIDANLSELVSYASLYDIPLIGTDIQLLTGTLDGKTLTTTGKYIVALSDGPITGYGCILDVKHVDYSSATRVWQTAYMLVNDPKNWRSSVYSRVGNLISGTWTWGGWKLETSTIESRYNNANSCIPNEYYTSLETYITSSGSNIPVAQSGILESERVETAVIQRFTTAGSSSTKSNVYIRTIQLDANGAYSSTIRDWEQVNSDVANKIRTSRPSSPTNGDIWIE